MKKLISLLLCAALLLALPVAGASAAGKFDKSVFQNSSKYHETTFNDWNIQGHYIKKYSNARIEVYSLLFSDYVINEWGPELRVYYYDPATKMYCQVKAFHANINGTTYCFDAMGEGDEGAGYVLGGKVQEEFFRALLNLQTAAFEIEYVDLAGNTITCWDNHIHTGELSDMVDMAKYLFKSNAFSTDSDPEGRDYRFDAYSY